MKIIRPVKIISFNDLSEKYGITFQRSHLYDLERESKFPKRVRLGMNRIGWVQSEIEAWLAEKLAARNALS
ncbi:transcriptional regulator, AlpA family [Bradyrhizobium brasilense]|uniref:Transcriptional regulator, AlpA family n=2 Tax=Bradyrhizobium brasilense TaxID=1419277 RepID=A0A1G7AC06_9BRAD|nr:transcriptional regulator, AlpA family [Bradyrhizobium brasilense]